MAKGPRYKVKYRRRREGKTSYRKRLKLLLSRKPRFVIRVTNTRIIAQVVEYHPDGDLVRITIDSAKLRKYGWKGDLNNTPAAYLTGLLLAKDAIKKGFKEGVLDIGLRTPSKGSRIFAALKGMIDGGLKIPHSPEIFPEDSRIRGEHIAKYYKIAPSVFSEYERRGLSPLDLPSHFENVKMRIIGS
ncbi:50S ribosomal protein L18 [Candidatus Bathyarchaeota archaeon]|nr:MAG: 50S ribosomal protein L18 [Candidatus Bathyarchaeota archaeon]